MNKLCFSRYAFNFCAAAAMLTGCGGSQPPIDSPGTTMQTAATATHADRGKSWMLPEAKNEGLLYAAVTGCNGTCVYSYPKGKLVGTLDVYGGGFCADQRGNVFLPSYIDSYGPVVYEFAHGGKRPITTLKVPGYFAASCSVDPITGNLAVPFLCKISSCGLNGIAVYQDAKGQPTIYRDANIDVFEYCGYDDSGNLFVDGSGKQVLNFAELPASGSSLADISIDQSIGNPGQVQWDGSYITIQDEHAPGSIYQLQVSGSTATIAGVTKLDGLTGFANESWIQSHTVLVGTKPRGQRNIIGFWRYPEGGKSYKSIRYKRATTVFGVTVSLAKH